MMGFVTMADQILYIVFASLDQIAVTVVQELVMHHQVVEMGTHVQNLMSAIMVSVYAFQIVKVDNVALVQEGHLALGHYICGEIERRMGL